MDVPVDAWRAFVDEPVGYMHPSRLASAMGGELSPELSVSLARCGRLNGRLSALIAERMRLPALADDTVIDAQDQAIAMAPAGELIGIALRAGAIFWSGAMANAVRGEHVAALESALGADLCRLAIKNRDLAGPERPLEPFDTLSERVIVDGWRCYAAWCDAVPPAIGMRARLKTAEGDLDRAAEKPFAQIGPAIIRRVAGSEVRHG
jgi:hypothetical protein